MVVCFKYGVFAVTNIARIRRTISCYCARKRRSLHPSTSHSNCKWSCTKDRNHTFTFIIIIQMYINHIRGGQEVGIEIAMCSNIQQSTMTFHTRYDTMTSTYQVVDRMVSVVYSLPSSLLIPKFLYLLLIRRQHDTIRFKTIKEGRRWIWRVFEDTNI